MSDGLSCVGGITLMLRYTTGLLWRTLLRLIHVVIQPPLFIHIHHKEEERGRERGGRRRREEEEEERGEREGGGGERRRRRRRRGKKKVSLFCSTQRRSH